MSEIDASRPHIVPAEDGLYPGVLDKHYFRWDVCSQSALKTFERSPAHLKAERDFPPEYGPKKQENLDLGSAFHMATLQPDEFSKWFAIRPEGHANSNAYKDRVAAMLAEQPFLRILKPDAWEKVERMRDAVLEHPTAGPLLMGSQKELSGVATDQEHGIRIRIRLDDVAPGIGLVDLKKTGDARPEAFGRIAHDLKYVRQGALYLRVADQLGIHESDFFFVVCEDERPHGVKVYRIQSRHLVQAEEELDALLARYGECERADHWPNYPPQADELWLPPWAERSFQDTTELLEEAA